MERIGSSLFISSPRTRSTAEASSLPYCLAAAIVDKKVTPQSFSEDKLKDPAILEVIDKIKGEASLEFEKMFPAKQPSRVVISTTDGRSFEEYLDYPMGDPRQPMTTQNLEDKFNGLSDDMLGRGRLAEVRDTIFNCENLSARDFMSALVV